MLKLPNLTHDDVVDTAQPGHPPCYRGTDVAISPLGDRAFVGFYYTDNIGMIENITDPGSNEIIAATAARIGCTPSNPTGCIGPGYRDIAFTPYLDKVLATRWWNTLVDSKVMVIQTSNIPPA